MTRLPLKLTALATTCALAAGGVAMLNASAAPPARKATKVAKGARAPRPFGGLRPYRRAVHAQLTVPAKGKFVEVTVDRGFVKAVAGDQLTVSESTRRLTGTTVTLTIPGDARVLVDRRPGKLADVKPGQHVAVIKLPKGTVVRARDR